VSGAVASGPPEAAEAHPAGSGRAGGGVRAVLVLLFFGSGCAALIYEIIWFQLLGLVIGSTAVSLGIVLGVFMGGLCLGSVALPRWISPRRHPLRVYAAVEAGIGICGVGVLALLPPVARIYAMHVGPGLPAFLLRGALCVACLLPATMLMGATLPAISRWVRTSSDGISWLGLFYAGNTFGAVFGSLLAGFYLLRVYDMVVGTCVAAALNASIALISFLLSVREPHQGPNEFAESAAVGASDGRDAGLVYWTIALSGLCALGAEVVWTRLLSLMLGGTVYAFSLILAVFLAGLGIGSTVGAFVARRTARPEFALGLCQMLLAAGMGWTAFMLARSLPYWPINPSLSTSPWFNLQLDLLRCAWAVLPPTCLWGASFPLALAAASGGGDPGRLVGRVYAANTAGAIVGAVGCSVFLIGWLGTQQVERLLLSLTAVSGLLMLWGRPKVQRLKSQVPSPKSQVPSPQSTVHSSGRGRWSAEGAVWLIAGLGVVALLIWTVPRVPWELVAYGRKLPATTTVETALYMGEGVNASVAVTEMNNGVRNFHISGKIEASTDPRDMRMQRMLGHLPGLLHPQPRSVLVVGCGAGVTAGSLLVYPSVEKIVICELEPLIPKLVARYFAEENYDVVDNPRVRIIYDDARHYILTTQDKFDIITSDPIHPWVKGAASLYTKEYFELCRQHLNPGGLVTQWVPLYESSVAVVRSELATFFDVFPQATVWSNDENGEGYDVVLLGGAGAATIDLGQVQRRLSSDDFDRVRQSLRDVGFKSSFGLMATYAGRATDLQPWLKHAQLNRDKDLRLQYLAGMGLNRNDQDYIFSELLTYRKFPGDLFVGSDPEREALLRAIEGPGKTLKAH
jgi:spermidine synthase